MEIEEKSEVCPICGFEFPSPFKLKWIAIAFLILFLAAVIYRLI